LGGSPIRRVAGVWGKNHSPKEVKDAAFQKKVHWFPSEHDNRNSMFKAVNSSQEGLRRGPRRTIQSQGEQPGGATPASQYRVQGNTTGIKNARWGFKEGTFSLNEMPPSAYEGGSY